MPKARQLFPYFFLKIFIFLKINFNKINIKNLIIFKNITAFFISLTGYIFIFKINIHLFRHIIIIIIKYILKININKNFKAENINNIIDILLAA